MVAGLDLVDLHDKGVDRRVVAYSFPCHSTDAYADGHFDTSIPFLPGDGSTVDASQSLSPASEAMAYNREIVLVRVSVFLNGLSQVEGLTYRRLTSFDRLILMMVQY